MAFQTESQRVLEGFNLRRASTVAHFALAIGARFHELDGPSGSHTIPLTILISLNIVQQTTVRELVHRARQDRVLGRIVGEFISGSLSERLGVCVINGNDELLHAARVLEYQIDHLQRYYDMEHVAGKDSFQGGDTEVETYHKPVVPVAHNEDTEYAQSNIRIPEAYCDYAETTRRDSRGVGTKLGGKDVLPTMPLHQHYNAWAESEMGGENMVENSGMSQLQVSHTLRAHFLA